jgi:hypothetical protein
MNDLAFLTVDLADEPALTRVTVGDSVLPTSRVEVVSDSNGRSSETYLLLRVPMHFVNVNAKPATGAPRTYDFGMVER